MNLNANNPYYVPKYQTLPGGGTNLNKLGMTQEEILTRNFKLEIGTRMREALVPGGPAKSREAIADLKSGIIRELMSQHEEGSLAFNILERMLERAQNQSSNDSNAGSSTNAKSHSDQVQISADAQNTSAELTLRESIVNNGLRNIRRMTVETESGILNLVVTADGIWNEQSGELVSSSQGVPGVPESTISELEHLSRMLQNIPPEPSGSNMTVIPYQSYSSSTNTNNGSEQGSQTQPLSFKQRLSQYVNAFAAVRDEYSDPTQNLQFSESAFRLFLSNAIGLSGQLARMNIGGESAAGLSSEAIAQKLADAQNQIDVFGETFLSNFAEHGLDEAFNMAWATIGHTETEVAPTGNTANPASVQLTSTQTAFSNVSNIDTGEQATGIERYTQMLLEAMRSGTGNGNPDLTGTPIQVLNAKIFNLSVAFGEMQNQSGVNRVGLELAFRDLVLSLFDEAAVAIHEETESYGDLTQIRADVRNLGQTFLGNFFNAARTITSEMLTNTRMTRTELSFHYAWNTTSLGLVGGTDIVEGTPEHLGLDGKPRNVLSDEEFQRLTREMLLDNLRMDMESARTMAESLAEGDRRWQQMLEIFRRMMRGDNVPQSDQDFLAMESPGLFMMVMAAQQENENPRDYEQLVNNGNEEGNSFSSQVKQAMSAHGMAVSAE
ncbi:MAG: hypothetical protein FWC20_06430 [Oscillospiraceae bacterium]|nr:hypothetical protein [Oscillospiraceae bacterium]